MKRLPVVGAVLAATGAAVLVARSRAARREHVSLRFEDGASLALERGSPEAERVLAAARRAVALAR